MSPIVIVGVDVLNIQFVILMARYGNRLIWGLNLPVCVIQDGVEIHVDVKMGCRPADAVPEHPRV